MKARFGKTLSFLGVSPRPPRPLQFNFGCGQGAAPCVSLSSVRLTCDLLFFYANMSTQKRELHRQVSALNAYT
jgi:hypothetical protein